MGYHYSIFNGKILSMDLNRVVTWTWELLQQAVTEPAARPGARQALIQNSPGPDLPENPGFWRLLVSYV